MASKTKTLTYTASLITSHSTRKKEIAKYRDLIGDFKEYFIFALQKFKNEKEQKKQLETKTNPMNKTNFKKIKPP